MRSTLKRVLIIGGFVLVVVGIGAGLWYVFFRTPHTTPPAETVVDPRNTLPRAGDGTLLPGTIPVPGILPGAAIVPGTANPANTTQPTPSRSTLLANNVRAPISAARTSGTGVRYYNSEDGRFYRATGDGTTLPLSDKQFFNVDDVRWGNASDQAILVFPDGSKILYDFNQERQATLPTFWEDIRFSPTDNQIATKSIGRSRTNRFLVIADPDGNNAKSIEELGDNQAKVQVSWSPNDQIVAFSHTGDALGQDRESVLLIGKEHENFQGLITDGRGFLPHWSPSGQMLVYSVYSAKNNYLPLLWVSGASPENVNAGRRNLNLATWADKCAWESETSLICGVPTNLPAGAALQRELFANTPDVIYRINLTTGRSTALGPLEENGSVAQISISTGSDEAFITEERTGKLFRFSL